MEIQKKLTLSETFSIYFDILSLNTGSISNNQNLNIESFSNCINVKPINDLVKKNGCVFSTSFPTSRTCSTKFLQTQKILRTGYP